MDRGDKGGRRGRPWNRLRVRIADAAETVFGPDPGLLRLRVALRTVVSAAITLTALLLLLGNEGLKAAAPIALGFMAGIFANISVRDPQPRQQGVTLALLAIPGLASVALASFLSQWQWIAEAGFVVVVASAALVRLAGPRAMALGMVGYIGYFIGEVTHPPLAQIPQLAIAVVIAITAAAVARFVLLPDHPHAALAHARRHIERRVGRILAEVDDVLAADAAASAGTAAESRRRRMHRELAQLSDAMLIAEDQIASVEHSEQDAGRPLSRALFALELAAERLMRMAAFHRQAPDREPVRRRIAELQECLAQGAVLRPPSVCSRSGQLSAAVDALQDALARLAQVMDALGQCQSGTEGEAPARTNDQGPQRQSPAGGGKP